MTAEDLDIIVSSVAPVMREFVTHKLEGMVDLMAAMERRMLAIEERALVPGPMGLQGLPGEKGIDGSRGEPGQRGEMGPQGERGVSGERGEKGIDGTVGPIGPIGPKGVSGRDGLPGVQGPKGDGGDKGIDGQDGAPGRDGKLENLKIERVSERLVRFCFKDGTPIEGGDIRLNHPVFKDLWEEGKTYEENDVVQWSGGGWIALRDAPPLKPGTSKSEITGWKLFIKPGSEGKTGKVGPIGPQGPRGEIGPVRDRF